MVYEASDSASTVGSIGFSSVPGGGRRVRPYLKCPDCKKGFKHRDALAQHRASHVEAKKRRKPKQPQHECVRCGKSFDTAESLNRHLADTGHMDSTSNRLSSFPAPPAAAPADDARSPDLGEAGSYSVVSLTSESASTFVLVES